MLILVAEDMAIVAMSLAQCLEDGGHEVLGPAATARAALILAESRRPDLALLDIRLGDGHTGVELANTLKQSFGVPSIFLSGQIAEAVAAASSALGLLPKPYSRQEVLGCVRLAQQLLAGERPTEFPNRINLFSGAMAGAN